MFTDGDYEHNQDRVFLLYKGPLALTMHRRVPQALDVGRMLFVLHVI